MTTNTPQREAEIEAATGFRAKYPVLTQTIANLIIMANTTPKIPIGQALKNHNDLKAVAQIYMDLSPDLGLPSDDVKKYLPVDTGPEIRGAENVVALSATFHTHPRYGAFYDQLGSVIGGFIGIYELVTRMGKSLSDWEEHAGGNMAYDNAEIIWDDLVDRYVDKYIEKSLADPDRYLPDTGAILTEALQSLQRKTNPPLQSASAKEKRQQQKRPASLQPGR